VTHGRSVKSPSHALARGCGIFPMMSEMVDLQPLFPSSARAGNDISAVQSGFRVSFGVSFLAGGAGVFGLAAGTGCCACFVAGGGVAGLVSGFGAGFCAGGGVTGLAGCGRAAGADG
jgi:hypothetical protein